MSFEVKGLDTVVNRLDRYQIDYNRKVKDFLTKLVEIGIDISSAAFRNAQYDGSNDVIVNPPQWLGDNALVISAQGQTITFIEFGAGVYYTEEHPKANAFGMHRGEYGQGKGKQNTWGYYGEQGTNGEYLKTTDKGDLFLTHGNPPSKAMYNAGKEMRLRMLEIAKEVFKFD